MPKAETERMFLYVSKEMFLQITERAKENERSLNKEIVWIVQQFLKQEQQKGVGANDSSER